MCFGPCIDTHLVGADNGEKIASSLVFSVYVKVYGLLKWELVRAAYSTKGVINGLWVGCSQEKEPVFFSLCCGNWVREFS